MTETIRIPGAARQYIDVGWGQLHVTRRTSSPGGFPLVLLHQTPRSADEYREVIAALPSAIDVIAPDLPGMGNSDEHPGGASIENFAVAVVAVVDALGLGRFDLVGHHTGGVVAIDVAAELGDRVRRLVLSSTPFVDGAARDRRARRKPIDHVERTDDGSHLTRLWQRRQAFYPQARADLLQRFVADALRAVEPEAGHGAVGRYRMEDRIGRVAADVLLVTHGDDPFAAPELPAMQAAFPTARVVTIGGGMVPLEFRADAFAAAVAEFVAC